MDCVTVLRKMSHQCYSIWDNVNAQACHEAADEIERLQKIIDTSEKHTRIDLAEKLLRGAVEIERLQAIVAALPTDTRLLKVVARRLVEQGEANLAADIARLVEAADAAGGGDA